MGKPRLRGWIHAAMAPVAVVGGVALVSIAPTAASRVASGVFAATAVLLFAVSALLHRGAWSDEVERLLRRSDHSNIYLIIAGTYTPVGVLALPANQAKTLLLIVWTGALAGVAFRVFWSDVPRWLSTALYVIVGWVAVFYLPALVDGAGLVAVILIAVGGILYTAGAVVYALKRPNPSPRWFGFHEVFHALTVCAFIAHYVAVWIIVTG